LHAGPDIPFWRIAGADPPPPALSHRVRGKPLPLLAAKSAIGQRRFFRVFPKIHSIAIPESFKRMPPQPIITRKERKLGVEDPPAAKHAVLHLRVVPALRIDRVRPR